MTILATTLRIPRARVYSHAFGSDGDLVDLKRADNIVVKVTSEPVISPEFDPVTCTKYEDSRTVLDHKGTVSMELPGTSATAIALALHSTSQPITGASVTYTTSASIAASSLVDIGCLPAGTRESGAFVPTAWTAVDSDDPTNEAEEGVIWEWYDAPSGIIKILSVVGMTLPLVFSGTSRTTTLTVLGDSPSRTVSLTIAAIDQMNACSGEKTSLWKCAPTPGTEMILSQALDSVAPSVIKLEFDLLPDITRGADTKLGRLGKIERG